MVNLILGTKVQRNLKIKAEKSQNINQRSTKRRFFIYPQA